MNKKNALLASILAAVTAIAVVMWARARPHYSDAIHPHWSPSGDATGRPRHNGTRVESLSDAGLGTQEEQRGLLASASAEFHVRDDAGGPVVGATVVRYEELGFSVLGQCDEEGILVLSDALPRTGVVTAVAPNMWAERIPMETAAHPVLIRMIAAGRLSGMVTMPDGSPAAEGVLVIAWPSAMRTPMRKATFKGMVGDPYIQVTETESNGSFEFEALDPRSKYTLAAGGLGYLTPTPIRQVPTDKQFTRLQLSTVLGARVRLVEHNNRPLAKSAQFASAWAVQLRLETEDPAITKIPDYLVPLSGVMAPETDFPPYTSLMFYAAADERLSVGPILGSASLPGYEPRSFSFLAQRAHAGAVIDERLVVLDSATERRGDLEIEFEGYAGECWDERRVHTSVAVRMSDSLGNWLEFELVGFSQGVCSIPQVPVGDYLLRVTSKFSAYAWPDVGSPAVRTVVKDGKTTRVVVPTHRLASISAAISDHRGIAYTGPAVLAILGETGTAGDRGTPTPFEIEFDRAPYCVGGLEPGFYKVAARFPLARSPLFDGGRLMSIAAGEAGKVSLTLVAE